MDFTDNKFVQGIYDFINFFKFKKDIKNELKKPDSLANRYGMKLNWLGNILYFQLNCNDTDYMNADYSYDKMLMMKMKPVVQYLGKELNWSDYLTPQISNFEDENGQPSLSFGVLFIFTGYSLTLSKVLIGGLVTLGLIAGGIIAAAMLI